MENQRERGINGGSRTCFHGSPRGTCSFADYRYTGSPLAGLGMHAERVKIGCHT